MRCSPAGHALIYGCSERRLVCSSLAGRSLFSWAGLARASPFSSLVLVFCSGSQLLFSPPCSTALHHHRAAGNLLLTPC